MPRFFRRFFAIVLLLGAWAFAGSDRAPRPLTLGDSAAARPAPRSDSEGRSSDKPAHDLSSLRVFTKVILYVKDNYVDPKRVKPKEMMIAALEYVEKTVPDVIVEGNADAGKLKLTVNGKARDFDISHVDSLWKMSFTMKDVFDYIGRNMRPIEDTRDVEYAAVNGMLSTLDPHSVLLKPEMYREMKLQTKGEFGGLGFVIQMKEGNLTVVRVLPKTPAAKAGIRKDDTIQKIAEESTVNMDLNEAVSKLRGPVDSKVVITVDRKSWDKPQVMPLIRATISIDSVQSKLLAQNVGYIRLINFQGNTTRDLQSTLNQLAKEAEPAGGMKGVVLDLRGNPGGLLEQAIQVSDMFLSQGTIVATVGLSDKLREEKRAHADEGDNLYPVVVLVNAGSASASEIVAGALKNLNRAVIVGRQTFGKGSVQVLYEMDDMALKLTIAKYLTPGDVSIQETGIVPDITLIPTRVTKERLDVFAPRKSLGEADLEHHFGNPSQQAVAKKREEVLNRQKSLDEVKYLKEDVKQKDASAKQQLIEEGRSPKLSKSDKPGKAKEKDPSLDGELPGTTDHELDDQLDAESQYEVKEDFEVLFARDFILAAPFVDRERMLREARPFVEQKRRQEEERIDNAIGALGIDWSPGATPKTPQLTAAVKPGPTQKIAAGEDTDLELTVENRGSEPLSRLRAWTDSDNPFLDRREFVFGAVKPGEKKSWKVQLKLPKDIVSRRDSVKFRFFDDHGALPETVDAELNFVEMPRPAFAFDWQVIDDCTQCNGDGMVQRGERVTLLLDVKNLGSGKAFDTFAQIKNAADQNIFIEKGRFKLGEIAPGETKTAKFQLEVKKAYKGDSFPLKLAIVDEPLEEFATEKLKIPVMDSGTEVELKKMVVRMGDKGELFESADKDARPIALLPHGGFLAVEAKVASSYKVDFEKGRFAFVHVADVKEVKGAKPAPLKDVEHLPFREPAQITLNVDSAQGGIVVEGDKFNLSGVVSNTKELLDMYVLVNDQKVFFKSASNAEGDALRMKFSTDFPLKEGNNNVLIVAREGPEFASRKSLVIRRRPPSVAQKLANP
ncbi:MAG TPA: MXAN_5808 family serine peptidase [Myxococcaceae bacterium]|nr:MXAN_5808 family serine peptidase [Myxococcaceae bacterium]